VRSEGGDGGELVVACRNYSSALSHFMPEERSFMSCD
jgi:hypothetical protein